MLTNESVMLDMISQLENLWMQADTTTKVKHYQRVYNIAWECLRAPRKVYDVSCIGDASGNTIL